MDEQVTVLLSDRVTVRRGNDPATSWVENRHHRHGQLFGDWYVRVTDGPDAGILSSPEAVFMVGHEPTGYRLIYDLTYWEARRIAMAMQDADLAIPDVGQVPDDPDMVYIVQAIVTSALMDHYVFPLCNYPELLSVACT